MNDLVQEKIRWFLEAARREGSYPLPVKTGREKALTHLNLLDDGRQTASRDLNQLVVKGVASRHGARRGVYYVPKGGMPQK